MLAQVWGLGLGFCASAQAAGGGEAGSRRSQHADAPAPALLDQLTQTVAPVLEHPAAPVEQVLQDRIRAGGLPLPGQATTVPDAFAIATVLLPSVPPQPRRELPARASRSGQAVEAALPAAAAPVASGPAVDGGTRLLTDTGPGRTATAATPAALPGPAAAPDDQDRPPTADELALAAATPLHPDGTDGGTAVLVPITAGLLLAGAAALKHRGLPRGH
ncbi:hypothetical protein AB0K43_29355 [Kitasatospora sp. NPDC049258]|uniref:hypothetical protein n=1 Tax=Kitasatospora sp. NPDC049258 TaxID=3155394 RepID=UPI00341E0865